MSKIIFIGRGESVNRSTKKFVDNHDKVIIINNIIYNGYEHLVSDHADVIFGNRTSLIYSPEQTKKLGLKESIFTGKSNQRFDTALPNVKQIYPRPNLRDIMIEKYGFDPASGIQALYYYLERGNITEISLIGFDFYEVGTKPYYFRPDEAPSGQKDLWRNEYIGDKINNPSGHDTTKSIDYLEQVIIEYPDIKFNIISNSTRVNNFDYKNCNIINESKD